MDSVCIRPLIHLQFQLQARTVMVPRLELLVSGGSCDKPQWTDKKNTPSLVTVHQKTSTTQQPDRQTACDCNPNSLDLQLELEVDGGPCDENITATPW